MLHTVCIDAADIQCTMTVSIIDETKNIGPYGKGKISLKVH